MKTTGDFLTIIKTDLDLNKLLMENGWLQKDYKPRPRRGSKHIRTRPGLIRDHFWASIDGVKFRSILEEKYSVGLSDSRLRSVIKDALLLYILEVISE